MVGSILLALVFGAFVIAAGGVRAAVPPGVAGVVERRLLPDTLPEPLPASGLRLSDVRGDPARYQDALVRWRVQFISVERADSLRSDMPRGAAYLLARDPGGEAGFVYGLIPPSLGNVASTLGPLQRVEIVGRVVAGSSHLTGHPILELVDIRP